MQIYTFVPLYWARYIVFKKRRRQHPIHSYKYTRCESHFYTDINSTEMILCYNNVLKKEEKNLKQFKNNSRGKKNGRMQEDRFSSDFLCLE